MNQDVEDGLVYRAEGLKDNSTCSWTEANKTQSDLRCELTARFTESDPLYWHWMHKSKKLFNFFGAALSQTVNTHRDRVNKQKEKGEKLRTDISAVSDNIKKIKRGRWIVFEFAWGEIKWQIIHCKLSLFFDFRWHRSPDRFCENSCLCLQLLCQ